MCTYYKVLQKVLDKCASITVMRSFLVVIKYAKERELYVGRLWNNFESHWASGLGLHLLMGEGVILFCVWVAWDTHHCTHRLRHHTCASAHFRSHGVHVALHCTHGYTTSVHRLTYISLLLPSLLLPGTVLWGLCRKLIGPGSKNCDSWIESQL